MVRLVLQTLAARRRASSGTAPIKTWRSVADPARGCPASRPTKASTSLTARPAAGASTRATHNRLARTVEDKEV